MDRKTGFAALTILIILATVQVPGAGKETELLLRDGSHITGELLAARDTSIVLSFLDNPSDEELQGALKNVRAIPYSQIQRLHIEGHSYVLLGAAGGLVVGVLAGVAIGAGSTSDRGNPWTQMVETTANSAGGAAVGALIGLVGGLVIGGAASSRDVDLDYNQKWDPMVLKPCSRYPVEEPEFLRAVR